MIPDSEVRRLIGEASRMLREDPQRALALLRECADAAEALNTLASQALEWGETYVSASPSLALAAARALAAKDVGSPYAQVVLGDALLKNHEFEAATAAYERALALAGKDANASSLAATALEAVRGKRS